MLGMVGAGQWALFRFHTLGSNYNGIHPAKVFVAVGVPGEQLLHLLLLHISYASDVYGTRANTRQLKRRVDWK